MTGVNHLSTDTDVGGVASSDVRSTGGISSQEASFQGYLDYIEWKDGIRMINVHTGVELLNPTEKATYRDVLTSSAVYHKHKEAHLQKGHQVTLDWWKLYLHNCGT